MAVSYFGEPAMRRTVTILVTIFVLCAPLVATAEFDGAAPTVLVTGANRGLGFEFTRQYAADGWNVIATARSPEAAEALQALAKEHPRVAIEQLDVRDLAMIDALAAKYSGQPIDVLLNNAGISGNPMPGQVFKRLDYDLFDDFMETNAQGPLKMSEAFLKNVEASEQKKIAVLTSKVGLFSEFDAGTIGTYFYRTSKTALNMLMRQVAKDVKKRGITVVLLNPGLVDTQHVLTEMNEKMKLGLTLVPIEDSIAGMRTVITETSVEDPASVHQWDGAVLGF
jgi:NAD(P)-dependent dehydrogenase (short-subunit alcohol dehydrogenase family)